MLTNQEAKETAARMPKIDLVWDSGSSLYDSFELNSFKRQLDSAISSRSFSMPHLSDSKRQIPPPPLVPVTASYFPKKKSSKISRSLHKFMRSFFKSKSANLSNPVNIQIQERTVHDDRYNGLTTIPESPEIFWSKLDSLAQRTVSDRFIRPTSVGISCA